MTDFSLHSVGVIMFKYNKKDVFGRFIEDVLPKIDVISLPASKYEEIIRRGKFYSLDFDDAYQYVTAQHYGLKIVTMDQDFKKTTDSEIIFL